MQPKWDYIKFLPHFKIASLKVKQNKFIMLTSRFSPLAWMAFQNTQTWTFGFVLTKYIGYGNAFLDEGTTGVMGANGGYQGGYDGFQREFGQGAPKGTHVLPLTGNPPPPPPRGPLPFRAPRPPRGLPLPEGPPLLGGLPLPWRGLPPPPISIPPLELPNANGGFCPNRMVHSSQGRMVKHYFQ
jgi:hypothetical protein